MIVNNTMYDNNWGIITRYTNDSHVTNNSFFNNSIRGFELVSTEKCNITQNKFITNTLHGIDLDPSCAKNLVQLNDFIGNNNGSSQATDNGTSNVFEYNYWSEWTSPDTDHLIGIVDVPYAIEGTANTPDWHPLVNPASEHYLLIPTITIPSGEETLSGEFDIYWTESKDTWGFSVMYNVSYSTDGGTTWTQITAKQTTRNTSWDTRLVPDGSNYILKVEAFSSGGLKTSCIYSTFIIDNILPTITIDSPLTQTYTTSTITVTLSGDAAHYWYYIESVDSQNQTWTASVDRTLTLGRYTLHAYVNDSAGNIIHISRTFTIEFVVPTTTTTTPPTTTTPSTTPPTTILPTTTEPSPSTTTTLPPTIEVGSGWNGYLLLIAFVALFLSRKRKKRS